MPARPGLPSADPGRPGRHGQNPPGAGKRVTWPVEPKRKGEPTRAPRDSHFARDRFHGGQQLRCRRARMTGIMRIIPNEFVFGYGLDLDELYRNLPFIGVVRD
jgi:hypothetical protein